MEHIVIRPGMRILFQGDSVTDAGRDRARPDDLGGGYPQFIAGWYTLSRPGTGVSFLNRGVSGDRTADLLRRWTADAVELRPDVVSILIGINDVWNRYRERGTTSAEAYEADLRALLIRTREETGAQVALLEPFVLPVPEDRIAWREDLDPKREAVRRLASEFGAVHIPLDGMFREACGRCAPAVWAADGVHPTPAGHALIARAWLRTAGMEMT